MDDKEIVRQFFERDEKALSAVGEKYNSYLIKIAESITYSHEDAEEIINDVLLKAWELNPPNEPEKLAAFLGKLTRNEAISRRRSALMEKRGSGEVPLVIDEMAEIISDGSNIEREQEYKELMSEISSFIRKQKPLKRDMFVCRYWYCMSVRELSGKFGVTESKVTVTLCRLRAKLKKHLQERGYNI
ncbi:MAG: sigma-70 family RNA polymerase sigma factor [Oscillospiraceae bacterium]|nr:sigma-70 family RNA polymerase sigma factor [Oscillospiraceae bacterium]